MSTKLIVLIDNSAGVPDYAPAPAPIHSAESTSDADCESEVSSDSDSCDFDDPVDTFDTNYTPTPTPVPAVESISEADSESEVSSGNDSYGLDDSVNTFDMTDNAPINKKSVKNLPTITDDKFNYYHYIDTEYKLEITDDNFHNHWDYDNLDSSCESDEEPQYLKDMNGTTHHLTDNILELTGDQVGSEHIWQNTLVYQPPESFRRDATSSTVLGTEFPLHWLGMGACTHKLGVGKVCADCVLFTPTNLEKIYKSWYPEGVEDPDVHEADDDEWRQFLNSKEFRQECEAVDNFSFDDFFQRYPLPIRPTHLRFHCHGCGRQYMEEGRLAGHVCKIDILNLENKEPNRPKPRIVRSKKYGCGYKACNKTYHSIKHYVKHLKSTTAAANEFHLTAEERMKAKIVKSIKKLKDPGKSRRTDEYLTVIGIMCGHIISRPKVPKWYIDKAYQSLPLLNNIEGLEFRKIKYKNRCTAIKHDWCRQAKSGEVCEKLFCLRPNRWDILGGSTVEARSEEVEAAAEEGDSEECPDSSQDDPIRINEGDENEENSTSDNASSAVEFDFDSSAGENSDSSSASSPPISRSPSLNRSSPTPTPPPSSPPKRKAQRQLRSTDELKRINYEEVRTASETPEVEFESDSESYVPSREVSVALSVASSIPLSNTPSTPSANPKHRRTRERRKDKRKHCQLVDRSVTPQIHRILSESVTPQPHRKRGESVMSVSSTSSCLNKHQRRRAVLKERKKSRSVTPRNIRDELVASPQASSCSPRSKRRRKRGTKSRSELNSRH